MQINFKKNHLFSKKLIQWFLENKRELPWRENRSAYKVWISEIMLQQTQVKQVIGFFNRFMSQFPTLKDLALAEEDLVLKYWEGLGYYSRARNLHFTAQYIYKELNGVFPTTYKELLTLKGIGDYTASAIASLVYKEVTPVVDGNVYRVLSRVFGIEEAIDSTEGKTLFKTLAQELISQDQPDVYNEALMEFGALYCTPKSPDCESCVFKSGCIAYQNSSVHLLPYKSKKTKVRDRFFNYFILFKSNQTPIIKRSEDDIWKGLYEFPFLESKKLYSKNELLDHYPEVKIHAQFGLKVHKLSHQLIHSQVFIVESLPIDIKDEIWVSLEELEVYSFPVLLKKVIEILPLYQN